MVSPDPSSILPDAIVQPSWTPEFSPISFTPTLSVDLTPISAHSPAPPRSSARLSIIGRRISIRNSLPVRIPDDSPKCPSSRHSVSQSYQGKSGTHERRRSKYLNDPAVYSMLDRTFEDALELGFVSPHPSSKRPQSAYSEMKLSPLTPSVDGTTIVEDEVESETEDDIFSRPTPDLGLPTLKELDDVDCLEQQDNVMTLRLTLTPATCLTEVEQDLPLETTSELRRRMNSLGRLIRRTKILGAAF